jgi:tetratricopeptide (TPR) repeat protein
MRGSRSSTGRVEFSLGSRRRAWVFLLGLGLGAVFIASEAIRIGIAASLEHSADPSQLRWALRLDPANPQLHYQLGLVDSSLQDRVNHVEAVQHLRRATELNPHRALYWLSLASACDLVQETDCADQALEHALDLTPAIPRPHWIAANRYLLTNRTDAALPHLRRLLELSPEYSWPAFRLSLAAVGNPLMVLAKVLPTGPDARLKLDYVNFLSAQGDDDSAYRVWTEAVGKAHPFAFSWAEPYLQHLLDLGRYKEAVGVWRDLERLGIVNEPAKEDPENLIFNGEFEQAPLNAGFDWRDGRARHVGVGFTEGSAYRGNRCLRVDFTLSQNEESEAIYQIVPVAPNRSYVLTAYTRSDNITSDSGPRLRVRDPLCARCLDASTEATLGTTPWGMVSLRFSTGERTQVLRVSVWRPRTRTFPPEITGTFWLDSVSITSVGQRVKSKG